MNSQDFSISKLSHKFNSKIGVSFIIIILFLSLIGIYLAFQPQNQNYTSYGNISDKLDFSIKLFDNNTINLSQFKGKMVLLDFFATWCYPCKLQVPILQNIHNQYPNLVIISVSVYQNDSYNELATYKAQNGPINWLYGKDAGVNGTLTSLSKFNIQGIPTTVLINKNGNIANMHLGIISATVLTSWLKDETLPYVSVVLYGLELNSSLGLLLFFLIGLYVALSPCLFPILPTTIMNILYKENEYRNNSPQGESAKNNRSYTSILSLWSGIVVSFGIIIITSSILAMFVIENYLLLNFIFGMVMILLGIIMLIPFLESRMGLSDLSSRILTRFQESSFGTIDLFILGSVYSIIAFPCAGPAILAMLPLLLGTANPFFTITALIAFSLGILLPYLIIGKLATSGGSKFISNVRNSYRIIKISTSILVIIIGLLLAWPYLGGPSILTFT